MNIVIGKNSNLSNTLLEKVDDIVLVSSRDIINDIDILKIYKGNKKNIIFNNFHPANQLSGVDNYLNYVQNSITVTAMVLEYFRDSEINKIVYSSSSSVYGDSSEKCKESDFVNPLNFYSSVKLANEMLVREYCNSASIDYTIARIFNMYGGNDNFSVIFKIVHAVKNNEPISLINDGKALRDFININDVVVSYQKLLHSNQYDIVNIANGKAVSINEILQYLIDKNIKINTINSNRDEINISIANVDRLSHIVNIDKFLSIFAFLDKEIIKSYK